MKKIILTLALFSFFNLGYAQEKWSKSMSKDDTGQEYQIYTLLSLNKGISNEQMALILVSPKDNIISKLGFASTENTLSCQNYCQYYIKFDNTASKYTFSIENKSIKLQHDQQEDFLKNIQQSKEMTLVLGKKLFYFNLEQPNWKYIPSSK